MDPLRLPRASIPSKAKNSTPPTPEPGQETRLPRLGDAVRSREGDDGLTAPRLTGEQARRHTGRSNNDLPLRVTPALYRRDKGVSMMRKKIKTKKPTAVASKRSIDALERSSRLSALDERVLILYHSSLKYTRRDGHHEDAAPQDELTVCRRYGPEATYAAVKIQKVTRGRLTRLQLAAFHGPKNQFAASTIQFAYRRALTRRRIARRVWEKHQRAATRIQAWYRGSCGRDMALALMAERLNSRIANFQRRFRGLRLWRVVAAMLHKRKWDAAREVQRVYRGWKARRRATVMRFEKIRFAQDLKTNSELHARFARCEGCSIERCSEQSLIRCVMARYLGLHDLTGAKALGEQGVRQFPSSTLISFIYSCLLQSICEDLEVGMAYLNRANAEGIDRHDLDQCEEQYFQAALMLRPNDAALHLHLAIFFQNSGRNDRAEAHYDQALAEHPSEYPVPGYLERVRMVDRLLLNYHRFCAVFNFRHVNVLVKDIAIAKRGPKIRISVAKLNHFTVIGPLEPHESSKINTVYLTDEELSLVLGNSSLITSESSSQQGTNDSKTYLKLGEWRNSYAKSSRRTNVQQTAAGRAKQTETLKWRPVITQLYQDEFLGLHIKPVDLAKFSLVRSRLRLTKESAEALLKLLVFVDPSNDNDASNQQLDEQLMYREVRNHTASFQRIMIIPRVLRLRFDRRIACLQTHASIEIQSVFRGYQFRAEVRRDHMMNEIHRRQVDRVFTRLNANYTRRETRRKSATAIQRIVRGIQQRARIRNWRVQAAQIQRVFRGYLGRKRAIAFREGSCTFYMAERVFQRGVEVSGRYLLLSIDKCGMTFRMDGYDAEACASYHGLLTHQGAVGLLCYMNWMHASSFCGQQLLLLGTRVQIANVESINPATGECFVNVTPLSPDPQARDVLLSTKHNRSASSTEPARQHSVSFVDCINAINLRRMGSSGKDFAALPLPMKMDDTRQLVDAIVERLVLVPGLPMATHELKRRNAAELILTVAPPPAMHYTFKRRQLSGGQQPLSRYPRAALKKRNSATTHLAPSERLLLLPPEPAYFPPATVFPVASVVHGAIIGKRLFRQKCTRHAVTHTRCRCVLPLVSTPAYVETLSLALRPPPPPSYTQNAEP